jgi:hypothetical protein
MLVQLLVKWHQDYTLTPASLNECPNWSEEWQSLFISKYTLPNQIKKKPLFPVQVVRLDAGQAAAEGRVRYLFAEGRVRLHSCSK